RWDNLLNVSSLLLVFSSETQECAIGAGHHRILRYDLRSLHVLLEIFERLVEVRGHPDFALRTACLTRPILLRFDAPQLRHRLVVLGKHYLLSVRQFVDQLRKPGLSILNGDSRHIGLPVSLPLAILPLPRRVVVQRVQPLRAFPPEVELAVRRLLRVLGQLALEVLPPALVAGPLEVALQLAQLPLLPVHASPPYALLMSRTVPPPGATANTASSSGS